jgi:hypothetical protein
MEKQDYKIIIKEQVQTDVYNQYTYYAENYSLQFAEKFRIDFILQVDTILPNIYQYPACFFLKTKKHIYRNIIWNNHLIIYKIMKNEIWIVGLFHTKQDPKKLKLYRKVK